MKKPKTVLVEGECPECSGTGFPVVLQPVQPTRRIYPPPCSKCGGSGHIKAAAN
jgi:DnaJ-class molecular chaperone